MDISAIRIVSRLGVLLLTIAIASGKTHLPSDKWGHDGSGEGDRGCYLGDVYFDIGETWNPETTEGQGEVPPCIECRCEEMGLPDGDSTFGEVICRNITEECPLAGCYEPTTKYGDCCATCSVNEFYALLVAEEDRSTPRDVAMATVARGMLTVHGRSLAFAIRVLGHIKASSVTFVDSHGREIYGQKDTGVHKQADYTSICGIWDEITVGDFDLLRSGHLYFVLKSEKGAMAGQIRTNGAIATETFEAILTSPDNLSSGLAFISIGSDTMDVVVIAGEKTSIPSYTTMSITTVNGKPIRAVSVEPNQEQRQLNGSIPRLTRKELLLIAREKIRISVSSSGHEISGVIRPKTTCLNYQAVLWSPGDLEDYAAGAGGGVIAEILPKGIIKVKVQYTGLGEPLRNIRVEVTDQALDTTRRLLTMRHKKFKSSPTNMDGKTKGAIRNMDAATLSLIIKGHAMVSLTTTAIASAHLVGYITSVPLYAPLAKYRNKAILLTGTETEPPVLTAMAGQTWITADDRDCSIHFQVVVKAVTSSQGATVFLESFDGRAERFQLASLLGGYAHGSLSNVTSGVWYALTKGKVYMYVGTENYPDGEIAGRIKLVNKCWRDKPTAIAGRAQQSISRGCRVDKDLYEEGDTWKPDVNDPCTSCSCKDGQVTCRRETCAAIQCETGRPVMSLFSCCPVCRAYGR